MNQTPSTKETIVKTKDRGECMEYKLVLDAVGIRSRPFRHDGWWWLEVRSEDAERAWSELDEYVKENPDHMIESTERAVVYGGAGTAVAVYAVVLVSIALLTAYQAYGLDWLASGRMHAESVRGGQWWRSITALTLHLDLGHLMSNLVFGAVFGLLAGRTYGGGVAWLSILIAGTFGNTINAWIQDPQHSSIGASTAVFGALALLVAHALRHWRDKTSRWKQWRPLIGGVVLLAFTGIGGERTDVAAHFTGFMAGLALGWIVSLAPQPILANQRMQQAAGITAIAIVIIAWLAAALWA